MANILTIDSTKTLNSVTKNSVKVYLKNVDYEKPYYTLFEVYQNGSLVTSAQGGTFDTPQSGIYKTITGLKPGTDYMIWVYLFNKSGADTKINDSISITTDESIPFSMKITRVYPDGGAAPLPFTVSITCKDPDHTLTKDLTWYYVRVCNNTGSIKYSDPKKLSGNQNSASATCDCNFTNPGTFTLRAYLTDKTGKVLNSDICSQSHSITITRPEPKEWAWSQKVTYGGESHSCPITSNGEIPTLVKVDSNNYKVYLMGATEWNEFCKQINLLRQYHGLSNFAFSIISPNGTMHSQPIKEAIAALSEMVTTNIEPAIEGEQISASTFLDLQNEFNRIRNLPSMA